MEKTFKNVSIRKFTIEDISKKVEWINDDNNNRYLHYDLPLEYDKTLSWYKKIKDRTDRFDAIIEYLGNPVGVIGLLNIQNDSAEYYVTLGEKKLKGKGISKIATYLLLKYAFYDLNLKNVYLYTEVENKAAQKFFEKCGFFKVNILKNSAINRGKLVDRFFYEITVQKFNFLCKSKRIDNTPTYQVNNESNCVYIKRDDLIPFSFGGNKARKAVYFFEEIEKNKNDYVVTYGSSSSNHCRIISNLAKSKNIPCLIISPKENYKETFNSQMMKLFDSEFKVVPVNKVHYTIENTLIELKEKGYNPYFIPGGGHGNLGTQAYVDCYREIVQYEKENKIFFDYIFHASGTGTTQAGLVCGQLINNDNRKIIGISIARKNPRGRQVVVDSINEYLTEKHLIINDQVIENSTNFIDSYTDGYGKNNDEINSTIKKQLCNHGIPMDSTYTAKAYNGMLKYLEEHEIKNKNILFIHTGGTPLFFDDLKGVNS